MNARVSGAGTLVAVTVLTSASILLSFSANVAAEPCDLGPCSVTVGSGQIVVNVGSPGAVPPDSGRRPVKFDPFTGLPLTGGLTDWTFDGYDYMFSESSFFRINNGQPLSWDGGGSVPSSGEQSIGENGQGYIAFQFFPGSDAVPPETNDGIHVKKEYVLRDDVVGVHSYIGERVTITNRRDTPVSLDWFVFTDLDLYLDASSESFDDFVVSRAGDLNDVQLRQSYRNVFVDVRASRGGADEFFWDVGYWFEFADLLNPADFGPFVGNLPGGEERIVLSGDFSHALQWSFNQIEPGQSVVIGLGKYLYVPEVPAPEPGSLALLGLGLAGLGLSRRRKSA